MTDEKKVTSWDELKDLEGSATAVIELPKTSEVMGFPVIVKVRAIEPQEFIKINNIPISGIDDLSKASEEEIVYAVEEQVEGGEIDQEAVYKMVDEVVSLCMVDPDPKSGDISKFKRDRVLIFNTIFGLSGLGETQQLAEFPKDGE